MAQNVVASFEASTTPTSTAESTSLDMLPAIQPGLLPIVSSSPFKATSTAGKKTVVRPSRSTAAPAQTAITAKSLLDATTLSMSERYDGPYKITFVTDAGVYGKITWDLAKTVLTIGKSIPTFSISSSCNPAPNIATAGAPDQNPTFDVRISYVCTLVLEPNSGSDRRSQTKQFSFTTGAGQLVITSPPAMNTLLQDNINLGGFVFRNDDSEPITVTGLDIDVSYTGLDTANTPLVLRFLDPITNVSLDDYHLEKLAVGTSSSYAHAGTGIHIPLSFTLNAATQKMLPITILGVQRLHVYGVDPTLAVTVREVTTNQNLNRVVLNSANVSWSCVIPLGAYDPNATSGPYATGQACR
jgi:hypothetical protein